MIESRLRRHDFFCRFEFLSYADLFELLVYKLEQSDAVLDVEYPDLGNLRFM